MSKRKLILGTNALFVTLLGFGILIFIYRIADRHHVQLDLSSDSRHELSDDMIRTLERIDAEEETIELFAFTTQEGRKDSGERNRYVRDLLKQLGRHSNTLKWRFIDYDKERLTAEELGVGEYGRIVIRQGNERVDIKERLLFKRGKNAQGGISLHFLGEEELLRAFTTLLNNEVKKAYVITGHGELSIQDSSAQGLSLWKRTMELNSFVVEALSSISLSKIPDDADLILIAQPKKALSIGEQDVVLNYISRGGSVILAYKAREDMELFQRLQVTPIQGTATDLKTQFPFWDRPVVQFGTHLMVQDIKRSELSVVVSNSSSFRELASPTSGIEQTSILKLSRRGWLERGGEFNQGVAVYQEGIDSRDTGTLGMAISLTPSSGLLRSGVSQSRLVLLGDAEWFSNGMIEEISGNGPLINSMVLWVTGVDNYFTLDLSQRKGVSELLIAKPQLKTIRALALLPMPTLVFAIGFLVWYNRRGR